MRWLFFLSIIFLIKTIDSTAINYKLTFVDIKIMTSYINIDQETDWAIFSGIRGNMIWNNFSVYLSYKKCLRSNQWIQVNNSNPRILTDKRFLGIL